MHEIYRSWRAVFEGYRPAKMAVAETWYPTNRRTYLCGRPSGARREHGVPEAFNRSHRLVECA